MLRDQACVIFGALQKAFKKFEVEMDYQHDIKLSKCKTYIDSLQLIAQLEQLINSEQSSDSDIDDLHSVSLDVKDHEILMNQLKDNTNLVNGYKSQIQEIKRQNQLISQLAQDQGIEYQKSYNKENIAEMSFNTKKIRNQEKIREIERKIKQKQSNWNRVHKRIKKEQRNEDHHILDSIDKLDSEIEKISHQIRNLLD